MTVLGCIGNTSLVQLRSDPRIFLKLESENPTGSLKDRMALAMIEAAEADGRLDPGGSVVEYTAGSTGVSLALVCAVRRYPLHIVTSDAFAPEKLAHMETLGAQITIIRAMVEGRIDGFVQSVGTAGSLRGNAEQLRRHNPRIRVAAVEPSESPVLSGGKTGSHNIDGVGAGFVVPLWRPDIADDIERVSTVEAKAMAKRLAREEGLFSGTSTDGNVVAAVRLADRLGSTATVVTIMCDTGMKYLHAEGTFRQLR